MGDVLLYDGQLVSDRRGVRLGVFVKALGVYEPGAS